MKGESSVSSFNSCVPSRLLPKLIYVLAVSRYYVHKRIRALSLFRHPH